MSVGITLFILLVMLVFLVSTSVAQININAKVNDLKNTIYEPIRDVEEKDIIDTDLYYFGFKTTKKKLQIKGYTNSGFYKIEHRDIDPMLGSLEFPKYKKMKGKKK